MVQVPDRSYDYAEPLVVLPPGYGDDVTLVAEWVNMLQQLEPHDMRTAWADLEGYIARYPSPTIWTDAMSLLAAWDEESQLSANSETNTVSPAAPVTVETPVSGKPSTRTWQRLGAVNSRELMRRLLRAGLEEVQASTNDGVSILRNPISGKVIKFGRHNEQYGSRDICRLLRLAGLTVGQYLMPDESAKKP